MAEIERDIERLEHAKKNVAVGKMSGAVGTYSVNDPFIENMCVKNFGLEPVKLPLRLFNVTVMLNFAAPWPSSPALG